MARDDESEVDGRSARLRWAARIFVVGGFALTVWLCGPRAVEVLAARYRQAAAQSPAIDLDQVGFVAEPDWLAGPLLLAISAELGPWLQNRIAILDEPACQQLEADLATSPWVREVAISRVFPDKFRLAVDLRRPVLGVQDGDGVLQCLVDRDGFALPPVETELPFVRLYREGGSPRVRAAVGEAVGEPRVLAAIGIALEWRDELEPVVPDCPRLLEIDTTNLGERWMRGRSYPEVRVKLARDDGLAVICGYGRPVDSPLPRVATATKATVLTRILAKKPALRGLVAADLRFVNRWADYLQPREPGVPDPDGPWSDLEQLFTDPAPATRPPSGR
ncbi:MAG: FtsQ-type POTRA domain-containing protein [Planctomycetes bacterium]|nr:FtsQ-type POTRA domain-containing protein [Planctomycetota bacterium]